jgi:hypothetical protein
MKHIDYLWKVARYLKHPKSRTLRKLPSELVKRYSPPMMKKIIGLVLSLQKFSRIFFRSYKKGVIYPVPNKWGKQCWTFFVLSNLSKSDPLNRSVWKDIEFKGQG